MQHLYNHETEFYSSTSTGTHLHSMNTHPFPYQHESPPQSSNSDVEERTSTPPVSSSSSSTQIPSKNGTNKIVKKKKQTKKKRKDPNEPQKPVSPYALFFRDTQNDIKKKLANPSFGEISKVVAHMWENIEPEVKEQYKRKAATAKKEYLKQLAAYRAVQVSQSATSSSMHPHPSFDPSASHHSTPLITENNNLLSSSHHSNSFPSYHPAPAAASMQAYAPSLSHPPSQFNNYNYLPNYPNDPSAMHYSNPYSNYSSYDSNNNFGDHGTSNSATGTHYGLLRPAIDSSEIYSSNYYSNPNETNLINENLLQNLNHSSIHYTDLSTGTHSHPSMEKHYDYLPPTLNELDHPTKDDPSAPSNSHFHWNSTTCLATQW